MPQSSLRFFLPQLVHPESEPPLAASLPLAHGVLIDAFCRWRIFTCLFFLAGADALAWFLSHRITFQEIV